MLKEMTVGDLEVILAQQKNKNARVIFSQMGIDETVYAHRVDCNNVTLELTFDGLNWDEYQKTVNDL